MIWWYIHIGLSLANDNIKYIITYLSLDMYYNIDYILTSLSLIIDNDIDGIYTRFKFEILLRYWLCNYQFESRHFYDINHDISGVISLILMLMIFVVEGDNDDMSISQEVETILIWLYYCWTLRVGKWWWFSLYYLCVYPPCIWRPALGFIFFCTYWLMGVNFFVIIACVWSFMLCYCSGYLSVYLQ